MENNSQQSQVNETKETIRMRIWERMYFHSFQNIEENMKDAKTRADVAVKQFDESFGSN